MDDKKKNAAFHSFMLCIRWRLHISSEQYIRCMRSRLSRFIHYTKHGSMQAAQLYTLSVWQSSILIPCHQVFTCPHVRVHEEQARRLSARVDPLPQPLYSDRAIQMIAQIRSPGADAGWKQQIHDAAEVVRKRRGQPCHGTCSMPGSPKVADSKDPRLLNVFVRHDADFMRQRIRRDAITHCAHELARKARKARQT